MGEVVLQSWWLGLSSPGVEWHVLEGFSIFLVDNETTWRNFFSVIFHMEVFRDSQPENLPLGFSGWVFLKLFRTQDFLKFAGMVKPFS